jgi:hypothetical protein
LAENMKIKKGDIIKIEKDLELSNVELRWGNLDCVTPTLHNGCFVVAYISDDYLELSDANMDDSGKLLGVSKKHGHLVRTSELKKCLAEKAH